MSDDSGPAPGTRLDDIDTHGIMAMIPHRYPMLMIDRVVEVIADQSAVGIKQVTANEPYFQGHFPGNPIMPGVLIVEAMAQCAAVLVVATVGPKARGSGVFFMSVEQARFRRPVVPGDTLRLTVTKERQRLGVWKFTAQGHVGDQLVAESAFTAKLVFG